jgi:hypothetical protein
MQTSEALRIIHTLADGVDPVSGELLAPDSAYQQPQLMRALYACIRALERQEQRERRGFALPANAGKPWDEGEDQSLKERFDQGTSVKEIAREHARTEAAIQARLEKFGRLTPVTETRHGNASP